MILYGVRWEPIEGGGFVRTEYVKPEEARKQALKLENEGKINVHIKLVDTEQSNGFVGDLQF